MEPNQMPSFTLDPAAPAFAKPYFTNEPNWLADNFERVYAEIFDAVEIDRPFKPSDIADKLPCLAGYAPRTRSMIAMALCRHLAWVCEKQEQNSLVKLNRRGKYVAPSG